MHGKDQTHQTQVMVSMQVADKNMIDTMEIYLEPHQLHLCPFSAVYKKMPVLDFD